MASNLGIIHSILHQVLHLCLRLVVLEAAWQILWRTVGLPFHREGVREELLGLVRYGLLVGFLLEAGEFTI